MRTLPLIVFVCCWAFMVTEAKAWDSGNEVKVLLRPLDSDIGREVYKANIPVLGVHLKHSAVQAFGRIYDFEKHGLKNRTENHELHTYNEHLNAGRTYLSQADFEAWFYSTAVQNKYRASEYNFFARNCQTFVDEACDILGVKNPHNDKKLIALLPVIPPFGNGFESSVREIKQGFHPVHENVVEPVRKFFSRAFDFLG